VSEGGSRGPQPIFALAVASETGLLVVAIVVGWAVGQPPLGQIAWSSENVGWGMLAAVPLVISLLLMVRFPIGPLKGLRDISESAIVPLFRDCAWWQLAVIAALAGLGEEALFRGVIQRAAASLSGSTGIGLTIGSVLFGLAHPISKTYTALATLVGFYLGGLLLAGDNLLAPIVTHAAYDFVALVYLVKRRGSSRTPPDG
jgi:uncharacterized protein